MVDNVTREKIEKILACLIKGLNILLEVEVVLFVMRVLM